MALFRRFTRSRGRGRTAVSAPVRRAIARKAVKRYNWVLGTENNACNPNFLETHACPDAEDPGPGPFRLNLLTADENEFINHDDATIVRMQGYVKFWPSIIIPETLTEFSGLIFSGGYSFRAGLRKIEQGEGTEPSGLDQTPIADPIFNADDWQDVKWIRRWQIDHRYSEGAQLGITTTELGAPVGVCSNTSAAAAGAPANTLTNGSGTINIPAISTSCSITTAPTAMPGNAELRMAHPRPFTLFMNRKCRIRLQGKQALVLDGNYVGFSAPIPDVIGVGFFVQSYVRLLLET